MRPTIVLDFDGTLALGNGPVLAFADAIADAVSDDGFRDRAARAVSDFESGSERYRDGYDAVTQTAATAHVAPEVIQAAYATSRGLLGTDRAPVSAPDGLAAFLTHLSDRARLELATNAPGDRIVSVLDAWAVTEAFAARHFLVGKPDGLVPIVTAALQRGPVLAVGDIAEFDLAPAAALGASTALVGATIAHSSAPTTMRGATLAELYDAIDHWVDSAREAVTSFSSHRPSSPTT